MQPRLRSCCHSPTRAGISDDGMRIMRGPCVTGWFTARITSSAPPRVSLPLPASDQAQGLLHSFAVLFSKSLGRGTRKPCPTWSRGIAPNPGGEFRHRQSQLSFPSSSRNAHAVLIGNRWTHSTRQPRVSRQTPSLGCRSGARFMARYNLPNRAPETVWKPRAAW